MPVYVGEEEVIKRNMALEKEKRYTAEFVESLPEGVRAELIEGQLFYMATPTTVHQGLLIFLCAAAWNFVRSHKGSCKVYPAPLAVYLNRDSRTYLEPDVIIVCDKSKMREKGCMGAPDFVAEIVSPSTRSRDYVLKRNQYQAAGVREYWVLDPEKKIVHTYDFEEGTEAVWGFGDRVSMHVLEGLEVDFSEFEQIFG